MKDKVDTSFYESAASYLGDNKTVEEEAPAQEDEAPAEDSEAPTEEQPE